MERAIKAIEASSDSQQSRSRRKRKSPQVFRIGEAWRADIQGADSYVLAGTQREVTSGHLLARYEFGKKHEVTINNGHVTYNGEVDTERAVLNALLLRRKFLPVESLKTKKQTVKPKSTARS